MLHLQEFNKIILLNKMQTKCDKHIFAKKNSISLNILYSTKILKKYTKKYIKSLDICLSNDAL